MWFTNQSYSETTDNRCSKPAMFSGSSELASVRAMLAPAAIAFTTKGQCLDPALPSSDL